MGNWVAVGAGVAVGGTEVAVAGTAVAAGCAGVVVGGIAVAVGGTGESVGARAIAVAVGGIGVAVGAGTPQPAIRRRAKSMQMNRLIAADMGLLLSHAWPMGNWPIAYKR